LSGTHYFKNNNPTTITITGKSVFKSDVRETSDASVHILA